MTSALRPIAIVFALACAASIPAGASPKLDTAGFDPGVATCTDFYQHANAGWIKANPIPAEYSSWGVFNELSERHIVVLREVLEHDAAADHPAGSNGQKLGDFYASAMDEATIEKIGLRPLKADFKRIDKIRNLKQLTALLIGMEADGTGPLFGLGVQPDLKNTELNIAYATQGGLSLPERDYYTRDDEASKKLRDQYLSHVERMLVLAGSKPNRAKADAAAILALETQLAKASLTRVELRDPNKSYRMVNVAEANTLTPHFDWAQLFAAIGHPDLQKFSQAQPGFFAEMDRALTDTPIATWKVYLRWHRLRQAAPYLSKAFVDEDFAFNGAILNGAKELRPRWKRVIEQVNTALGEALGEQFVARAFPPEAKAQALTLVQNLQAALKTRIQKLDWMGDETKAQALAKFETFTPKIGYPDRWRDYSALGIRRGDYVGNVRAALIFETHRRYAKIGKPVDRSEWNMLPQTVNAYYNATSNEIVFPAAILQPPFFDPDADAALNYGAIGAVIGHELMHGYDDRGSQFDAKGNLNMWWTDVDRQRFNARTDKLVAQFDSFVAIDDIHVNGKLTLGENIADLGGLLVAYDAFQAATANQRLAPIDGLTPNQRFFHAWARAWRRQHTDENLKLRVNTDSHAPANFRVMGPFSNLPIFHEAFGCKAGDAMVRPVEARVEIW
jgi:putative endopeptidase